MRDVTLITPTADQPYGIALAEQYMQAQTALVRVAEWIVADDGIEPAKLALGQRHIRREREPGDSPAQSLARNLLAATPRVSTEFVVVWEHDDAYLPRHLETLLERLERPGILAAGDDEQRYYHVGARKWIALDNVGAALCQTGLRADVLPMLEAAASKCLREDSRGIDAAFWAAVPDDRKALYRAGQVVGIKGLPGRAGIGIGHRPDESCYRWHSDPEGHVLRAWCGPAARNYSRAALEQIGQ